MNLIRHTTHQQCNHTLTPRGAYTQAWLANERDAVLAPWWSALLKKRRVAGELAIIVVFVLDSVLLWQTPDFLVSSVRVQMQNVNCSLVTSVQQRLPGLHGDKCSCFLTPHVTLKSLCICSCYLTERRWREDGHYRVFLKPKRRRHREENHDINENTNDWLNFSWQSEKFYLDPHQGQRISKRHV